MADVVQELGHWGKLAKGESQRRFNRPYCLLRQPELLMLARAKIRRTKGAKTPGVDGPKVEFERAASLASMDHESIRLDRWQDRTSWPGWVYPWFGEAVRDVLAGEQSASEALGTVKVQAEEFVVCVGVSEEVLGEDRARACARQVDPGYRW